MVNITAKLVQNMFTNIQMLISLVDEKRARYQRRVKLQALCSHISDEQLIKWFKPHGIKALRNNSLLENEH